MNALLYSFSIYPFDIMDQTIVLARGLMGFGSLNGGRGYIKGCGYSKSILFCLPTL
jgi:hypothetical protein